MVAQEVEVFFETVAFGRATGFEMDGGWDACVGLLRDGIAKRIANQYPGEFLPDLGRSLFQDHEYSSNKDGAKVG